MNKWILLRITGAILFLGFLGICAGGVFLCEGTVHLPPNPIDGGDTARAQRIAAHGSARLEEVEIAAADGVHLKAWFVRASKSGGPVAILLHGQADTRRGMLGSAAFLLRAGYNVLLPDARGHGDSGGLASYGIREVSDVSLWIRWLESALKPDCVYGLGASMGAAILLQSLPSEPKICAAVAESPFSTFHDIGVYRTGSVLGGPNVLPGVFVTTGFAYARMRYGFDFDHVSPADAITQTKTPVLLIHGTADTNIPVEESRIIQRRRPENTELWEIPGAGHVHCYATAGAEYENRILAWFQKHRPIAR